MARARAKTTAPPPRQWKGVPALEPLLVAMDSVHRDPANARKHGERNLATIKASLARFGQQRPILIDADSVIRAGNGTQEAAEALGWTHIAAVRSDLKGVEATAYAITDNRSAELAEWDGSVLAETLEALRGEPEFELEAVGFDDAEVDALLEGLASEIGGDLEAADDPGAQTDRAEELQEKWRVAVGDLWVIPSKTGKGEHRLLCGDSTKAADVARVMAGEKADLCFTSPPYNLGTTTGGGFPKRGGMWSSSGLENGYATHGDDLPQEEYFAWQASVLQLVWDSVLTETGAIFYNHRPRVQDGALVTPLTWNPGLLVRQIVIWNSGAGINFAPTHYRPACEWIVIFAKPEFRLSSKGDSGCGDVWSIPAATRDDGPPAPFPVDLPVRAFETTDSRIVFEPYAGSGTTIVAAEQTGRVCRGIEIAPKYVSLALERLSQMGLEPRRIDQ